MPDSGDISARRDELTWLIEMDRSPRYIIQLAEQLRNLAMSSDSIEAQDARDWLDTEFVEWLGPEPFEKMARAILSLEDVPNGDQYLSAATGAETVPAPARELRRSTDAGSKAGSSRGVRRGAGSKETGQVGLGFGE